MNKRKKTVPIGRRSFVRSCVGLMALSLHSRARAGQFSSKKTYNPALLVDIKGRPFSAGNMTLGETYIFHYPFQATPCFLINLGEAVKGTGPLETESGQRYEWPGGVGKQQSVVAFSAICAHKMTHPSKSISFINYRPEKLNYLDKQDKPAEGNHLIYCCSERSVYDARDGARVLGGPAGQPLASIGLKHDQNTDSLVATSIFGGDMFDQYFAKFTPRLQLEYRITDVAGPVGRHTVVQPLSEFTESRMLC